MEFRNRDFIELVKRTREELGVGIQEAHDVIFAEGETRRIVAWRVNHVRECRKEALRDMRRNGGQSRFVRDGDRTAFKKPDGQR